MLASAPSAISKKDIPFPKKETVTNVGTDDFAFRKRYTYGTIMVDIKTYWMIDLLRSREIDYLLF